MSIRSSAVNARRVSAFLLSVALPLALLLWTTPAAQAAGPSPSDSPTVSVTPTTGGPGDPLTVSGAGWPAGDDVQIQIGGSTVCQLVAGAQGSISGDQANGCRVPPGLSAGSYALTAADLTNASGQATGASFTVPAGPLLAAFNPTSATVLAGSPVAFDASGSSDPGGDISSYAWSFGDGGSATGVQTSHKYLTTGTFGVTLTVTDSSGHTSSIAHPITVIAPPPIQTLILTPVANPAIVTFAHVSTSRSGLVRLGKRLFCPGAGPGCTASVLATSSSLAHLGAPPPRSGISAGSARAATGTRAGSATIAIGANHSAAVAFKLSTRALALLRKRHHIPARVKIVVVRGNQTTISRLTLTLRLR